MTKPAKRNVEQRRRRNIMRSFKIDEISVVDNPAQQGAVVAIMKRRGEPGYDPKNPDPNKRGRDSSADEKLDKVLPSRQQGESEQAFIGRFVENAEARAEFPDDDQRLAVAFSRARKRVARDEDDDIEKRAMLTGVEMDHAHLLVLDPEDGSGASPAGKTMPALTPGADMPHAHPWIMNEDGDVLIGTAEGHDHEAGEISVTRTEAMELLMEKQEAAPDGGRRRRRRRDMTDDAKKAATDHEAEKKALEAKLAAAEAYGKLSDAEKAHYSKLDADDKAAFIGKSDDERATIVKSAAKAAADQNPVVYTAADGSEYRKNDDARLIALAKQSDERLDKLEKAQKDVAETELRKRAETELQYLPGKVETHMALLKQVDAIEDDEARQEALRALKAHNTQMGKSFAVVGTSQASQPDLDGVDSKDAAEAELEKKARALQKADGKLSFVDAYAKASEANPELYAKAVAG